MSSLETILTGAAISEAVVITALIRRLRRRTARLREVRQQRADAIRANRNLHAFIAVIDQRTFGELP